MMPAWAARRPATPGPTMPHRADPPRPSPVPLALLADRPRGLAPLPSPLAPLVGRAEELAALGDLLLGPARLVTLTGPGGVGKTRLALAAAAATADGFAFVALAAVRDPDLVVPTVARVLGLREAADRPLAATLAAFLSDRRLL